MSILEEFSAVNCAPETCAYCHGNGGAGSGFACSACRGQGSVLVAQPAKKCAFCLGNGGAGSGSHCPVCKGTGWAHAIQDQKTKFASLNLEFEILRPEIQK